MIVILKLPWLEKDVASGVLADGRFVVSKDSHSGHYALKDEVIDMNCYLVIPLHFLILGDLAFYALSLGKEGSSGAHCYICESSKVSWQDINHEKGNLWTIEKICQVCSTIVTSGQCVKSVCKCHWLLVLMWTITCYLWCILWWASATLFWTTFLILLT